VRPWLARVAAAVLALSALLPAGACGDDAGGSSDRGTMLLATTTSTRDSGLLDELLPTFQEGSGCSVKTLAVGSGEAMRGWERRRRSPIRRRPTRCRIAEPSWPPRTSTPVSLRHEVLLGGRRVHQQHVGVAAGASCSSRAARSC
jgi:hypothetical protein